MTYGCISLVGTGYLARSKATCAYVGLSDRTVFFNSNRLDIRIPFSSGMSVGVRNSVSRSLTFSANFTFPGHLPHLLTNHKISVLTTRKELYHMQQGICKYFFTFSTFTLFDLSHKNSIISRMIFLLY